MLKVRTKIAPSNIHGIGLYAAEPIPKGTLVWEFSPGLDIRTNTNLLSLLPKVQADQLRTYGYNELEHPEVYYIPLDDTRFINHSDTPNLDCSVPEKSYAARDIAVGEELTEDYRLIGHIGCGEFLAH